MPSLVRMCTVRWILLSWLRVIRVNPWLWLPSNSIESNTGHSRSSIIQTYKFFGLFLNVFFLVFFFNASCWYLGASFSARNICSNQCRAAAPLPLLPPILSLSSSSPASSRIFLVHPQNWTVVFPSFSWRLAFLWPHKTSSTEQEISGWKGFSRPWLSLLLQLGCVQFYKFQSVTYVVIDKLKDSGTPF